MIEFVILIISAFLLEDSWKEGIEQTLRWSAEVYYKRRKVLGQIHLSFVGH